MRSSERADLPRWKGEPGFFEIWFLVVLDPSGERAWWLRYTLFAPAPGARGEPRATVWAAAFDRRSSEPARALKSLHSISEFDAGTSDRFAIRIGASELATGVSRGRVASGDHAIEWDLRFAPSPSVARRGPRGFDLLPLPTHVSHSHDDVTFTGVVSVDGTRHEVRGASGLQKHIWGTRRVEALTWLYCPRFREDPEARLEALTVQPRRSVPGLRFSPIYLRTSEREHAFHEVPGILLTRLDPRDGELRFEARSATRSLRGRAWCDPRTLVGYAYRDPEGWDVHVAQSDVAECEVELFSRAHPLDRWRPDGRLTSQVAALEFHAPEPLDGARYLGWDATHLEER
ncbi:hypothetical protein [Sandaracinus amylolyticus]|uniref:Uncharacterized protein n=1 Tax=Sandaracinus amylolyticus TaxID=927083 RepID=A0A0F6YN10_9BACT|nr:hypothetical protein [Sandaracinus amylolyticus]AKF11695.1 hypothetical protein DB32_008844 [Sandaracinus amylolyticus]